MEFAERARRALLPVTYPLQELDIMIPSEKDTLVCVYSSPLAADAAVVHEMLLGEGIRATTSESNGPFAGSVVSQSEVLVWKDDEQRARSLIENVESKHHKKED